MALTAPSRRRDAMERHETALTTCLREQAAVLLRLETGPHHGAVSDLRPAAPGVFRPGRSGRPRPGGPAPPAGAVGRDRDHPRAAGARRSARGAPEAAQGEARSRGAALSRV